MNFCHVYANFKLTDVILVIVGLLYPYPSNNYLCILSNILTPLFLRPLTIDLVLFLLLVLIT